MSSLKRFVWTIKTNQQSGFLLFSYAFKLIGFLTIFCEAKIWGFSVRFGLHPSNKKWVWVHKVQNNSEEELNMKLINWRSSVKQGWKLWLVRNMNISVWLFPLFCRAPSPLSFKWSEIRFKINFQYNPCYPFTCD